MTAVTALPISSGASPAGRRPPKFLPRASSFVNTAMCSPQVYPTAPHKLSKSTAGEAPWTHTRVISEQLNQLSQVHSLRLKLRGQIMNALASLDKILPFSKAHGRDFTQSPLHFKRDISTCERQADCNSNVVSSRFVKQRRNTSKTSKHSQLRKP